MFSSRTCLERNARAREGSPYLCVGEDLPQRLEHLLGLRHVAGRGVELQELEELDLQAQPARQPPRQLTLLPPPTICGVSVLRTCSQGVGVL